ncbi:MAG: hypothetical protein ACKVKM_14040, partial [Verrucomicrobiia bacterium]
MKQWFSRIAIMALFFAFTVGPIAAAAAANTNSNDAVTQKTEGYKKTLGDSEWVQTLERNLGQKIMGISAWQFVAAFLAILAGLVIKRIVIKYIERKITAFVEKTEAEWDDLLFEAIIKPVNAFVMIGAIHVAAFLLVFNLANFPAAVIGKSYTIFLGIVLIWGVYRLVDVVAHYLDELVSHKDAGMKGQFVPLIKKALRIMVVIVGGLTILATIGVNIT